MILPNFTVSGSQRPTMVERHIDAAEAIRSAITAMTAVEPNARDYVATDFNQAQREHKERVAKLVSVLDDLTFLADYIDCYGAGQ